MNRIQPATRSSRRYDFGDIVLNICKQKTEQYTTIRPIKVLSISLLGFSL